METNKNIFFIGFMGCGKSTMARLLSEKKGMELIDSMPDVYAVFITDTNELVYSDGAEQYFQ